LIIIIIIMKKKESALSKIQHQLSHYHFWIGIASFFLLGLGIVGAISSTIGACAFCFIPALAFGLSIVGISTGVLIDYNIYLISFGVIFLILSIFLFVNKERLCKVCKLK